MSSEKKCCVPGCSGNLDSRSVLHLFPNPAKDMDRFKSWLFNIGGDILAFNNEYIYKNRRVCHAHFEPKYCCRNNRISNIAVPTLNLPGLSKFKLRTRPTEVRVPLTAIENLINIMPSTSKDQPPDSMSRMPLISMENILENIPSTSKDQSPASMSMMPLNSMENIPSTSKGQPQAYVSRKRTLSSMENKPSTSKEIAANAVEENETKAKTAQSVTCYKKSKGSFKINSRSPAEMNLNKKLIAARIKLSKFKNKIATQARAIKVAKNIINNPNTLKSLEHLTKSARIITLLQLRESKKKNKGRRFSYEEKIVALSLLKQSPKGYRLLRKMFVLPAPQTLIKLIANANIQPGINKNIFEQMKKQAEKMKKPSDKLCVLLFDEMALKTGLAYNERLDKVSGFVCNGAETTKEFANHPQVFMIRGLVRNYKQPIGYTFSAAATKGPELARQIKMYIKEITKAGLTVVATICDQGAGNRNAIKLLVEESKRTWLKNGEEPKNNIFLIDNLEIVPLYDAPHLIKCIRNNLMVKNLNYTTDNTTKTAKWKHLEYLFEKNPAYQGIRLIPKLTENHINPAKMNKMKVKLATQIFSQKVATNMGFLADNQLIPVECKETADILLFFDTLFDSMNGSYYKKHRYSKPALGPVTPNSVHHKIWLESKKILKTMKFVKNNKNDFVPTLSNWVWTLDGMEVLFKMVNLKYNINSLWARQLNQDPLENFFGSIRSHGCRNTNPTPERFQSAFATLLINNLASVHAPGNNCEDDIAVSLHALVINEDCKATKSSEVDIVAFSEVSVTPITDKLNNPVIKATLEYCSGYFAKKCKQKIFKKCEKCNGDFISTSESSYIKYREFQNKRWLCSPTIGLTACISEMQDLIKIVLLKNITNNLLKELMKTLILTYVDFSFITCQLHTDQLKTYLVNFVCRFFIYNYCKNINSILSGKRNVDDNEDMLQLCAKQCFDKCYNRKK